MEGHVIKKVKILEAAASESFLPLICSPSHTCFNCLSVFSIKKYNIFKYYTMFHKCKASENYRKAGNCTPYVCEI